MWKSIMITFSSLLIWSYVGGFDWVLDSFYSFKYDEIATECEFYYLHGMNFESYDTWLNSVTQTWEFNKQVGFKGSFLEVIDNQTYENMKFMVRTYQQEDGMFNFFRVYV